MRYHRIVLLCVGAFAGCVSTGDERWRTFNDDGVRLFAKAEYAQALDHFDLALTLRPDDPVLIFNTAQCLDRLGDFKKAEQFYTYCLQRDPKHADARLALVSLEYRAGRAGDARKNINDWFVQEPNSPDPYVADAWRLRQEKSLEEAHARLHQALSFDRNNRRALTELAIIYESIGMPERSLALYEGILEREPHQLEIAARVEHLKAKGVRRPLPN